MATHKGGKKAATVDREKLFGCDEIIDSFVMPSPRVGLPTYGCPVEPVNFSTPWPLASCY